MKIQPNSKLLLIGDSITDFGRARPIVEANGDALGTGYVSLINACLTATIPQARIRIVNMGMSGNTVRDSQPAGQAMCLPYTQTGYPL